MASIFIIEQVTQGGPMWVKQPRVRINDKCNLWWTLPGKTSKGQKLMKAANSGPMQASHPIAKKLMINATYNGPLQVRHPKAES